MSWFLNEKGESDFPWGWLLLIAITTGGFGLCSDDDKDETRIKTEVAEEVKDVKDEMADVKEEFKDTIKEAKEAFEQAKKDGKDVMEKWTGKKETEKEEVKEELKHESEEKSIAPDKNKSEKDPEYL